MSDNELNGKKLSFDEFKLFYESTEKVTDRRIQTNRWNYSICIAILVAIASLTKWSLSNPAFFLIGISAVLLLCIMAALFCTFWIRQITDFKSLNNAKFDVLNKMAHHIEFDLENPEKLVSYRPFEKEWEKLEKLKSLRSVGKTNIIALQSSNFEYYIPKAFRIIFVVIFLTIVVFILPNWKTYSDNATTKIINKTTTTQEIQK